MMPDQLGGRFRLIPYAFTLVTLLAVLAVHLYWLPISVQATGHAVTNLVGQEIRWNMFSADPRGIAVDLWAEIEHGDGSVSQWRIDPAASELSRYRWVRWLEAAVLTEPAHESLTGLAAWLKSTSTRRVVRVDIFGWQRLPGPVGGPRPDPRVARLYGKGVAP